MRYQIETLATCLAEIDDLARRLAFEELVADRSFSLDINWRMYQALERVGRLQVATAREDDGTLSGYHVCIWNRHPHRGIVAAEDAASFIRKAPGRIFRLAQLYRVSIAGLLASGIRPFHFRFRSKNDHSLDVMLRRLGFRAEETVYAMTVR